MAWQLNVALVQVPPEEVPKYKKGEHLKSVDELIVEQARAEMVSSQFSHACFFYDSLIFMLGNSRFAVGPCLATCRSGNMGVAYQH